MTESPRWPAEPDPARDLLLETRTLRALTHRARVQILGLLRDEGPSTATRLARQLGLNSGATSYHLRCLAGAGLITEDGERGNGRDRWWQAAYRSTFYDPADVPPGQREMSTAYLSAVAAQYAQRMQRAVEEYPALPDAWLRAWMLSDFRLRLTPGEHERLLNELVAVIGRYRRYDAGDAGDAGPGAEKVTVQLQSFIHPGSLGAQGET